MVRLSTLASCHSRREALRRSAYLSTSHLKFSGVAFDGVIGRMPANPSRSSCSVGFTGWGPTCVLAVMVILVSYPLYALRQPMQQNGLPSQAIRSGLSSHTCLLYTSPSPRDS